MTNVDTKRIGDKLVLTIDISDAAKGKSWKKEGGKLDMIASTHGFTSIEGVRVSLNVGLQPGTK